MYPLPTLVCLQHTADILEQMQMAEESTYKREWMCLLLQPETLAAARVVVHAYNPESYVEVEQWGGKIKTCLVSKEQGLKRWFSSQED